jgi:hypothetical protein
MPTPCWTLTPKSGGSAPAYEPPCLRAMGAKAFTGKGITGDSDGAVGVRQALFLGLMEKAESPQGDHESRKETV